MIDDHIQRALDDFNANIHGPCCEDPASPKGMWYKAGSFKEQTVDTIRAALSARISCQHIWTVGKSNIYSSSNAVCSKCGIGGDAPYDGGIYKHSFSSYGGVNDLPMPERMPSDEVAKPVDNALNEIPAENRKRAEECQNGKTIMCFATCRPCKPLPDGEHHFLGGETVKKMAEIFLTDEPVNNPHKLTEGSAPVLDKSRGDAAVIEAWEHLLGEISAANVHHHLHEGTIEILNKFIRAAQREVVDALNDALIAFRAYEYSHKLKGTEDGIVKMKKNARLAEQMEKALAIISGKGGA